MAEAVEASEVEATVDAADKPRFSRRGLLGAAGAGVLAGAAAGGGATFAVTRQTRVSTGPHVEDVIRHNYSPHGPHQAGITTPTPAVTHLIALDLAPAQFSVDGLRRLLKLWSADIAALMAGRGVLGDVTPEMAQSGVSLSVTVGFGPRIFTLPGLSAHKPAGFMEIPPLTHDRLDERWSSGDLLLMVAADDQTTVAYATRALLRDAETFATVRWVQQGFWRGTNAEGEGITGRNLFGQIDGTANPKGKLLEDALWPVDPPAWFAGGTCLVVRRIEMDLPEWDKLSRNEQQLALGRDFAGAPLTGGDENALPDFAKHGADGKPVIPMDAHVRRSHPSFNKGRQILRRGLNYVDVDWSAGQPDHQSGLIFCAFCADIAEQFVPLQRSVDQMDALNTWTTAIGSSVWAIPPGFAPDSFLARGLLS